MSEKTIKKCEKAKSLMDGGASYQEAINQAGLGSATFYEYRKANGLVTKKHKKAKARVQKSNKPHVFVDLHREPTSPHVTTLPAGNVAVIVCQPGQINAILQGLR